jgi:excisionase family DNA binding protein
MPPATPVPASDREPRLVDISEAAERLGVPIRFMRRLVDERRIPFHKIGRYVRFDPADLEHFVKEGRVETANR